MLAAVLSFGGCRDAPVAGSAAPGPGPNAALGPKDLERLGISVPEGVESLKVNQKSLFTWIISISFTATRAQYEDLLKNSTALPDASTFRVDSEVLREIKLYSERIADWTDQELAGATCAVREGTRKMSDKNYQWRCSAAVVTDSPDALRVFIVYVEEAKP